MKRQRFCFFLIVWLLMFSGEIFSQEKSCEISQKSYIKPPHLQGFVPGRGSDFKVPASLLKEIREGKAVFPKVSVANDPVQGSDLEIQPMYNRYKESLILRSTSFREFNLRAPVAPSHYSNQLGFICRTELKMDRITPVPFRFRLGSLDYVNWMEKKPNAARPQ